MKIGIVGAGNVGATIAYTLTLSSYASEVVLVDVNLDKARGEVLDLRHCVPFAPYTELESGGAELLAGADVVVVAAGIPRKPGESRLDLAKKNNELFKKMIPGLVKANDEAVYVIVANPVDIMTYAAWKYSGLPKERVFGSGNILDTMRFRSMLGAHFSVDPACVNAYVLGEHGDSSFPVWAQASIGCVPIKCMDGYDKDEMARIGENVKTVAADVIRLKGATYYAIGLGAAKIVEAICLDQSAVFPVSTLLGGYRGISDVCLSVPAVVNGKGVDRVLKIPLNEAENRSLIGSAEKIGKVLDELGLRKR
ncbi:MAG: L-lactate dehydrogenase [Candidatus Altiarchaeota archaeon]